MNLHRLAIVALSSSLFLLAAGCSEEKKAPPAKPAETRRAERPAERPPPPEREPEPLFDEVPERPAASDVDEALRGYVSTTALYVRSGPGTMNPVVGVLLENDPVTIIGTDEFMGSTWWQIEAAGGYLDGWVGAAFMEHGEPPVSRHEEVGYGEPRTPTLVDGPFQYVGVGACKTCHVESTGAHPRGAYPIWDDQLHSEAYASLSRDYTREIAKRVRGVDDPATDWRCLKCHVTAYGAGPGQLAPTYRDSDGVGCEVCHGPGSEYAEADHGPSNPDRYSMGFMKLTNLDERETLCVACHNEASPTYKPFNVMAFSREIRHWPDPDDAAYFAQATARAEARESERQEAERAAEAERARQLLENKRRAEERAKAEAGRRADDDARARAEAEARARDEARAEAKREADETAAAEARARARAAEKAEADRAAKAALEAKKAEEAAQRARQAEIAKQAQTGSGSPLDRFLKDVPEELTLNKDGIKRDTVRFTHAAHASATYVKGVKCQTCHHTQEGDEKPEPCSSCHDPGGDAGEEKLKSKATHTKSLGFPPAPGEEHVSCIGCHKSQNTLLDAGKRTGEEAPTKCSSCHDKKRS